MIKSEPLDEQFVIENVFADYLDQDTQPNDEFKNFLNPEPKVELKVNENRLELPSTAPTNEPHLCDYCGHTINSKHGIRRHILEKHVKNHVFPCKLCPMSFRSYAILFAHRQKAHSTGEFKCDYCDKVCNNRQTLREHYNSKHAPKKVCEVCGKMVTAKHMGKHKKIHADDGVSCEFCEKTFKNAIYLKTHIREVHVESESTCEICGSVFGNQIKLKKHILRQHSTERLKCPVVSCSYNSPRKSYIKLHLDHHRDIDQDEKDRLWMEVKKIKGFWI